MSSMHVFSGTEKSYLKVHETIQVGEGGIEVRERNSPNWEYYDYDDERDEEITIKIQNCYS